MDLYEKIEEIKQQLEYIFIELIIKSCEKKLSIVGYEKEDIDRIVDAIKIHGQLDIYVSKEQDSITVALTVGDQRISCTSGTVALSGHVSSIAEKIIKRIS